MLKLLLFSTLVAGAFGACLDNGDKLINGLCFKLVNQPMTFEAARDWCHYQNSVTPSYLAYISSASTANFLSTYARTAFSTSTGSFWIGLSRNSSISSTWYWDNGKSLQFSNFQSNQGDFVSQSISNGKWDARKDTGPLPFVCSYDPAAPPTFPTQIPMSTPTMTPPSPTTTDTTDPNCSPQSPSSFLFAYSNDFEQKVIIDSLYYVTEWDEFTDTYFQKFTSIRFDTTVEQEFKFGDMLGSIYETVNSHLPDKSIGFSNSSQGSNILDVIEKFLSNQEAPICGSVIQILLKRHPNPQDTAALLARLQKHHVFIQTISSNNPIGSSDATMMYNLTALTNGFSAFVDDEYVGWSAYEFTDIVDEPYMIYAINPRCKTGEIRSLPELQIPPNKDKTYWLEVNFQDHGPVDSFQWLNLTFVNTADSKNTVEISFDTKYLEKYEYDTTATYFAPKLHAGNNYTVILSCEYSSSSYESLQIRITHQHATTYWPPYLGWI